MKKPNSQPPGELHLQTGPARWGQCRWIVVGQCSSTLDDLHLAPGSLAATRKVITDFIEKDMNQNDEAAITSASGQIGFLQQLTDQKAVLRAALQRLKYRPYSVRDFDRPANDGVSGPTD